MAVLKDDPQPPPSYSESQAVAASSTTIAPSVGQPYYGPTPINAESGALLRSYDVAQAMAQADARALRRFFGALMWALVIWVLVGILAGEVVDGARRSG